MINLVGRVARRIVLSLCIFAFTAIAQGQVTFYNPDSIQEIRITFKESNWRYILDSLFLNYGESGRLDATVNINGEEFKHTSVRYKGFSSYDDDQAKNPFNIDLNDHFAYQNYQGFTKLKLSNVTHDPSFVREVLAYEIARNYMPASRANFANVYVNDTLLGLYTNVEAVDDNFTENHFGNSRNTFFKGSPESLEYPFGQNSNLAYTHGNSYEGYMPYYKLESGYGWDDIFHLIDVLNNDTANIAEVLNIDRALWMHAFNYSMINLDSYIGYSQNYYMYEDDNGIFNTIPWDLNMSFGSFRFSDGTALNLSITKIKQLNPLQHLYNNAYTPRPLMKNLFANSTYRKMYLAHLRTIMTEQFSDSSYYFRALYLQNIIDSDVQNDTNKFYSYADFLANTDSTTGPTSDQYPGLLDLMEARKVYLDTFYGIRGAPELSNHQFNPTRPAYGENCVLNCKASDVSKVFAYYRFETNGRFTSVQMFDDGAHNDGLAGDSIFGTEFEAYGDIINYYFWAENDSAGRFLPERAQYEFFTIYPTVRQGKIVINELNLNDGWLELLNLSDESLQLSSLNLIQRSENETILFIFPDTIFAPGNYIILWLDGNSTLPGLHTWELPADTGSLVLAYTQTSTVDSLQYGLQIDDLSYGSFPNGSQERIFLKPTMADINRTLFSENSLYALFPNPASNWLHIETTFSSGSESIEIFNSCMQKLYSQNNVFGNTPLPAALAEIDVSTWKEGLYILRIQNGESSNNLKFLIVR